MGIPSSVWFAIAAAALVLGLLMLRASQRTADAPSRDRQQWAARMQWEYLESDPVLPNRWHYGSLQQGGSSTARNLVTGSVPTPEGRRLVYVFDHEQAGRRTEVVLAVQRRSAMSGVLELRLPSAPLPDDADLELLEQVGQRFAFVTDAGAVRPLITQRLERAADAIGEDVELVWAEDSWVLCTAPLDYSADMLQELLDQLVDVAAALEQATRSGSAPELRAVDDEEHYDEKDYDDKDYGEKDYDEEHYDDKDYGEKDYDESSSSAATWARSFTSRSAGSSGSADSPDSPADPSRER